MFVSNHIVYQAVLATTPMIRTSLAQPATILISICHYKEQRQIPSAQFVM